MKIKELVIVLENCEVVYVPNQNIGVLEINDIKTGVFKYNSNAVTKDLSSDEVYIEVINPNSFKISSFSYDEKEETPTCLERILKFPDITAITLEYDNNTNETISVLWNEEDEYNNKYQKAVVSKNGNLHILISDKELKEYLDEDGYYDFIMNFKEEV